MAINKLKPLKGLKGINSLTESERNSLLYTYKSKGYLPNNATMDMVDRLYRNRLAADKFGKDIFKQYTPEQIDELYKNVVVDETFNELYSPYFGNDMEGRGPTGQLYDSSKGLGSDFFKYQSMSADNKLALMESGFRIPSELEKELKEKRERENEAIQTSQRGAPTTAGAGLAALYSLKNELADPIQDTYKLKKNQAILDRIWAKDLEEKEAAAKPYIDEYYNKVFVENKVEDADVVKVFMNAINPPEGEGRPSILAAYFDADGNSNQSETKEYSVDDMRRYLSRKAVLDQMLGPEAAQDALDNEAKKYLHKHQSTSTYLGLLTKDILISSGSYTADKWNMVRRLELASEDKLLGDVEAFIDNDGNIVPTKDVNPRNGQYFYKDAKGNEIPVHKRNLSRIALDDAGLDEKGEKRGWFNNQQFWNDAERFGTMDESLHAQYKKIGYSPFKPVYEAGDETDIFYETAKMLSFGLADAGISLLPVFGESMAAARGLTRLAKGLSYLNNYANPLLAAGGIGNAYGRGVYSESFEQNMMNIEQSLQDQSQKAVHDLYMNNEEYRKSFDADVEKEFQALKQKENNKAKSSDGKIITLESKGRDELLRDEAKRRVIENRTDEWIANFKKDERYGKALEEAHESASSAALTTAILDGSKYAVVNMWGFRSYLFKSGATRIAEKEKLAASKAVQEVTENGKPRLRAKNDFATKKARAWKATKIAGSQFWGGAWTNFTDEMQSTGGRQMNEDRMGMYLNGMYDTQAMNTQYTIIDALHSRLTGASKALIEENTWKAGLVGGLGSVTTFLPTNISGMMSIKKPGKSLRESWSEMSKGEKVNAIISNGILNEYYSGKQGQANVAARVAMMNELMDRTNDFRTVSDVIAMNLAAIDATNEADKEAIKYVQGVQDIALLHSMQNDPNDAEIMSNSSIMQKAMNTIEELSDVSKLSDEKKEEYLSQFYAANPNIAQSDAQNEAALNEMQSNARSLKESVETFNEIQANIDKVENESGERLSNRVKGSLLTRLTLDKFLTKKLNDNEAEISGKSAFSERHSPINPATYGTKKSQESKHKSLLRLVKQFDKEENDARKLLAEAEKKLDDFNNSKEAIEDEKTGGAKRKVLEAAVNIARGSVEMASESNYQVGVKAEELRKAIDEGNSERVLTSEEILNLNPVDRARMLDKNNRDFYSKEQKVEISKLEKELQKKDPSLLKKIQEQGRLYIQSESNSAALNEILSDPILAGYALEEAFNRHQEEVSTFHKQRYVDAWNEYIQYLKSRSDYDFSNAYISVYKALSKVSPDYLRYMDRSEIEEGFGSTVHDALKWSEEVYAPIHSSINKNNYDETFDKALRDSIDSILDSRDFVLNFIDTKEQFINKLNEAINNPATSQPFKDAYEKLRTDLEQAWALTSSRPEMTEEEKKAAEEERNRQWLEQQRAQAEAEEKSKAEAERKAVEEALKPQVTDEDTDTSKDDIAARESMGLSDKDVDAERNRKEEEIAALAAQGLTPEDNIDKAKDLTPEEIVQKVAEGEEIDFESPTAEEELRNNPDTTVEVNTTINTYDSSEEGITDTSESTLIGNTFFRFDKDLVKAGIESPRMGASETDKMSKLFNWLNENNINLQGIIDDELYDISTLNPTVHIIALNPKTDSKASSEKFLAVEYTKDVSKFHNDDNGGVIEADGKKYLMIGILGYNTYSEAQRQIAFTISDNVLKERYSYFQQNPSKRFHVNPIYHTKIKSIGRGWRIKQTVADDSISHRSVGDLVNDPNRNPKGYRLSELPWVISYDTKQVGVNIIDSDNVRFPRELIAQAGSVFLLIPASDGSLIPSYIQPVTLSQIKEGSELKRKIDKLILQLASLELSERLAAKQELRQFFPLSKEGDNILVGTESKPTVSIVTNGVKDTVDLRTANSSQDIVDLIYRFNPRINITVSTLKDTTLLEMYSEAGVLNTDTAKLGTSNASFNVYSMDINSGEPVGEGMVSDFNPNSNRSDLANKGTAEATITLGTEKYSLNESIWRDKYGNKVTRQDIIDTLNLHKLVENKVPDRIKGNNEIFIINYDKNNPRVIIRDAKTTRIVELSREQAIVQIDKVSQEAAEKEREERIKAELEREKSQEKYLASLADKEKEKAIENAEDIDFDDDLNRAAAQLDNNFSPPADVTPIPGTPAPSSPQVDNAKVISSRVITDSDTVNLVSAKDIKDKLFTLGIEVTKENEDDTFYIDLNGKIYPRATSILAADVNGKRMPKNSPWILPSTTLGNGLHQFVEDVMFGRAGDSSTYSTRYPNAENTELIKIASEVRLFRAELDKNYDIVGTELTLTGEIKVLKDGKVVTIPVAGTVDFLLMNKETGEFKIMDIKTKRGSISEEDKTKWRLQQTLYSHLLQQKYGAIVEGFSILPFNVVDTNTRDLKYPAPSSTYKYTEKKGQLYLNGHEYKANFTKLDEIDLKEIDLDIRYEKLTPKEQLLVKEDKKSPATPSSNRKESPVEAATPKPTVNVNEANRSLAELQQENTATSTDLRTLLTKNKKLRDAVKGKFGKQLPRDMNKAIEFLASKGLSITNINDIDKWIQNLEECK